MRHREASACRDFGTYGEEHPLTVDQPPQARAHTRLGGETVPVKVIGCRVVMLVGVAASEI